MFSTDDYIELISSGVDAGMVSLVEGAYKCMFEATSAASIPVRPVDYMAIAKNMGIDISDCYADGEADLRAVERKVTGTPEYNKLKYFVDRSMDLGLDYSGLGYRGDDGVVKYTHPELARNVGVRNSLGNLKSSLMVAVSGANGIDLDNNDMVKALGRSIGTSIHNKFAYVIDRYARDSAPEISPDDVQLDSLEGMAYLSRHSKVQWIFLGKPGTDGRRLESTRGTEIGIEPNGNADSVYIDDNEYIEWRDALECIAFGPVNGVDDLLLDYCEREYSPDTWVTIISQIPTDTLVGLSRKAPGMYGMIVSKVTDAGDTSLVGMLNDIAVVVKAYDGGDLDDAGVADIVEHAGTPGYALENYGPDLIGYISSIIGPGRPFDTRPLSAVPDLTKAVTGNESDISKVSGANGNTYFFNTDSDFGKIYDHAINTPSGIRLLSSPDVQWKICRERGLETLISLCTGLAHNIGYCVPLDQRIMRGVFSGRNRSRTHMDDVISMYSNYVGLVMGSNNWYRSKMPKVSARNTERILNDVRQYITPRVQRELYLDDRGRATHEYSTDSLNNFIRWVPGFRLEPILSIMSEMFEEDRVSSHHMPTTAVIATLHDALNKSKYNGFDIIIKTTSPDVLEDVFHKTPSGLRVIDLMTRILSASGKLARIAGELADLIYAGDDGLETSEQFLSTYVVPKRAVLADTVTSLVRLEMNEMSSGRYSGLGNGMSAILDKLRETNGKRPSIASMLFLSRGNWFDFNTKAWENPVLKFDGMSWLLKQMDIHMSENDDGMLLMAIANLAGQNMLSDIVRMNIPFDARSNMLKSLFLLDMKVYGKVGDGKRIISDEEFSQMIADNPKMLLVVMDELSPDRKEMAKKICFTPEFMDSLANSLDGMRLLLELGKVSGMEGFSQEFIITHRNKIADAIDLMEQMGTDEREIAEIRSKMLGGNRNLQQEGGKINDSLLGRVEFSIANGLRWMTGFVQLNNDNEGLVQNDDGNCTLFSRERAENLVELLGKNSSWRLPTSAELENLGSADTIAKLGIGFSETGKADESGNLDAFYSSGCYAWYSDNGTLGGYSVTYDMIDIDDSDIEEGDMLAIKLVSRI